MSRCFRFAAITAAMLALAGCATPEMRLRTALKDAGLSDRMASCMAQRMAQRLTTSQLQRLTAFAPLRGRDLSKVTVGEYIRRVEAIGDPEVITVTTTSAAVCAIP